MKAPYVQAIKLSRLLLIVSVLLMSVAFANDDPDDNGEDEPQLPDVCILFPQCLGPQS